MIYDNKNVKREWEPNFTIDDFMWHNEDLLESEWYYNKWSDEEYDGNSARCIVRWAEKSTGIMSDFYLRHIQWND